MKEKAKELVEKFISHEIPFIKRGGEEDKIKVHRMSTNDAKQCALICVEEIEKAMYEDERVEHWSSEYYAELKNEIEKL